MQVNHRTHRPPDPVSRAVFSVPERPLSSSFDIRDLIPVPCRSEEHANETTFAHTSRYIGYWDLLFREATFELFVDRVGDKSHEDMGFDPTASPMVHRTDSQVRFRDARSIRQSCP